MPIYQGVSTKNKAEIIVNGQPKTRVYVGNRLVWQKASEPVDPCAASLVNGLIGYYKLNDTTDVLVDEISAFNFTNIGGNLQQPGLLNKCIGFDALSSDYFSGTAAFNNLTNSMAISFWVKFNAVASYSVLNWGHPVGTGKVALYSSLTSTGNLNTGILTPSGSVSNIAYGIPMNVWHNVTILVDLINKKMHRSFNGSLFGGSSTITQIPDGASFDGFMFWGRYVPLDYFRLNGYIDDIKIWNRMISDCENQANYNNGLGLELNV